MEKTQNRANMRNCSIILLMALLWNIFAGFLPNGFMAKAEPAEPTIYHFTQLYADGKLSGENSAGKPITFTTDLGYEDLKEAGTVQTSTYGSDNGVLAGGTGKYYVMQSNSTTSSTITAKLAIAKTGTYKLSYYIPHEKGIKGVTVKVTDNSGEKIINNFSTNLTAGTWADLGQYSFTEGKDATVSFTLPLPISGGSPLRLDALKLEEASAEPDVTPSPDSTPDADATPTPTSTPSGEYPPEWGDDYIVFDDITGTFEWVYPEGTDATDSKAGMSSLGSSHRWTDNSKVEGTYTLSNVPAGKYEAYVRIPVVHPNNTDAQYFTITDSLGNTTKTVFNIKATQDFGSDNNQYVQAGESATGIKSMQWNKLNGEFTFYRTVAGTAITGVDVETASPSIGTSSTQFGNIRADQIAFVKVGDVVPIPVAIDVKIEGKNKPGVTLTASYSFVDDNNNNEKDSAYKWYAKDTESAAWTEVASGTTTAAQGSTYTLKENERFAKFEIVPKSDSADPAIATGTAATAEFTVTQDDLPPQALDIAVEGKPYLKAQLTGTYTYQDINGDTEGESKYQWLMSSDPYASDNDWTVLEEADSGKYIRYSIIAKDTNGTAGDLAYSSAYLVKWNLKFFDEFDYEAADGTTAPFTDKWVAPAQARETGGINMARIPDNVSVQDHTFRIISKNEHLSKYNSIAPNHTWTTGSVRSKQNWGPYGYYESSMKYAPATGMNESFWWTTNNGSYEQFMELDFCEGHYPYQLKSNLHRRVANSSQPNGWETKQASLPHYPFGNPGTETLGDNFNKIAGYIKPNDDRYDWTDDENKDTYQIFFNDEQVRSTESISTVPTDGVICLSIAIFPGFAGELIPSPTDQIAYSFFQ